MLLLSHAHVLCFGLPDLLALLPRVLLVCKLSILDFALVGVELLKQRYLERLVECVGLQVTVNLMELLAVYTTRARIEDVPAIAADCS